MTQEQRWQLDGTAAELYQRYLVPAITAQWAADLIERAAPQTGERILDVACGTGVVARLAAERTRTGRVIGLDLNTGMLAVLALYPAAQVRISSGSRGVCWTFPSKTARSIW